MIEFWTVMWLKLNLFNSSQIKALNSDFTFCVHTQH